jgi:HlyD family secretion protein
LHPLLKDRRIQIAVAGAVVLAGWLLWPSAAIDAIRLDAGPIRETLQLTGRVVTRDRVMLASQVVGTVTHVNVDAGSAVKAGQVLIGLENPETAAAAREADAGLAQAEARLARLRDIDRPTAAADEERARIELGQAERQVRNLESLQAAQSVSTEQLLAARESLQLQSQQYDTARLRTQGLSEQGRDWKLALATVAQAGAARDVARARLGWLTVRAPADGLIVARQTEPGALVQQGQALLEFVPRSDAEVVIDVDERFLDMLREKQAVMLVADAYPEVRLEGSVARIAPRIDAERGTVEAHVLITRPPDWLREDMTTSVEILVGEKPSVTVVPVAAVMDQNSRPWVWCVENGTVKRCDLRLGLRDALNAEVLAGATAGTVVIAQANKALKAGTRVRVRLSGE